MIKYSCIFTIDNSNKLMYNNINETRKAVITDEKNICCNIRKKRHNANCEVCKP